MGSIANMLLAQTAPAGTPAGGQGGLTPEALKAIQALNQGGIPAAEPTPAPTPTPAPVAPAEQQGVIARFLQWLLPSTQSLAAGAPTPPPPTAEGLAQRQQRPLGQ